jgi:flagellar motor switch protein FliM
MTADEDVIEADSGSRRLKGALLEHSGLPVERMPGLVAALEGFIAEAPQRLAPLVNRSLGGGTIEPAQPTTLFQAIGDCAGLTAAIYASEEPEARMLIALDERIDDLIVASIFGESVTPAVEDEEAPRPRTPIETALVEEFARALGRALEGGFAPAARLSLAFEGLATLEGEHALGRRDMPAAAARFSLPMAGGACEGMVLLPQSLLAPFRKELERARAAEAPAADRRWSNSMESEVKQTRLPVTAILEQLSMSLGDVANFTVGTLLPLRSGDFESVRLECAGRGMFLCKLGQGDGRYRLEIETPIAEPPDPIPA